MQIITTTRTRFNIEARTVGRSNVRLDVAPLDNPGDIISMPMGRRALFELLSTYSAGHGYNLLVEDKKGRVVAKNGRRHSVDLTADEADLLSDRINELRGIQRVASRL